MNSVYIIKKIGSQQDKSFYRIILDGNVSLSVKLHEAGGIEQVIYKIYNRGVSGLNTDEFLENIDTLLLDLEPSKIFINIGTNDITKERFGDQWMLHLMDNICRIMEIIKFRIPDVEILSWRFILQIFACHGGQNNQSNG